VPNLVSTSSFSESSVNPVSSFSDIKISSTGIGFKLSFAFNSGIDSDFNSDSDCMFKDSINCNNLFCFSIKFFIASFFASFEKTV
jgi:hypothetical protein